MSEKKVVSRNVAVTLGIINMVLLGSLVEVIVSYTSIVSEKDKIIAIKDSQIATLNSQVQTLTSHNNQLQGWLDGNRTLLNRMETWLQGNITYYESQVAALNSQIASLASTYNELLEDYRKLQEDYAVLENAGLVFDGLKVSDLKVEKGGLWLGVLGNVTNVSDRPMSKVYVVLFTFNPDGSLEDYHVETIGNLAVNETNSFEFPYALSEGQTFKVVAVGSYGLSDVENSKVTELLAEIERLKARIRELEGMLSCEVYVLTDQAYYYSVRDCLKKANSSILVVMYLMVYDPNDPFDWANDLVRELVNAKNRGVSVTVIIEYKTYFGYMNDNLEAYNYLSSNGVNVKLDSGSDIDHLKLIIVDDYIVYVGSHNWSESSLYYNHETSVKIVSREIAQIFKQYIETNYR